MNYIYVHIYIERERHLKIAKTAFNTIQIKTENE